MRENKKNVFILSCITSFAFALLFIFLTNLNINTGENLAADTGSSRVDDYVALSPIDGLTTNVGTGDRAALFAGYLQNMYIWGVSIAVVLSIVMIIFGAIQYMTTDSVSNKTDGKEKMRGAIIGLLLALSSYLILNTINPQLVNLSVTMPAAQGN